MQRRTVNEVVSRGQGSLTSRAPQPVAGFDPPTNLLKHRFLDQARQARCALATRAHGPKRPTRPGSNDSSSFKASAIRNMGEPVTNVLLTHLAVKERIGVSMRNQGLSGPFFLYRHALDREIGEIGKVVHARKANHLPVVFTPEEASTVLHHLRGGRWLMASLVCGYWFLPDGMGSIACPTKSRFGMARAPKTG